MTGKRTELGEEASVGSAARLFQQLCYNNKRSLLAGIICAGWDRRSGGSVYTINLGGALVRQPFSIGGSGSTYIYGFCDANFREHMRRDECVAFVTQALALAMARDGSSGGVIRTVVVEEAGITRSMIPFDKLPRFWQG